MTTPQSPQQGAPQAYPTPHPQQGHAPQPGRIPPQWAPAASPHPGHPRPAPAGWAPVQAAPRNGLGIAAICLGIVGVLFGMVPLTGFIAFGLGAVGLVLGLVGLSRARKRVATNLKTAVAGAVLSIVAVALGIWGMVILFTGLSDLAEDLGNIPSASAPATGGEVTLPTDVTTPAVTGPRTFQLEITGDAEKMMVGYGTSSANSFSSDYQSLPWRKTVESQGDMPYAHVNATSSGPGSITCTITDTATGEIVDTETAESLDDSEYASAMVSCNSMGY